MYNEVENPMVLDHLWRWQEGPELPDHWEDDRTDDLVEEFAVDCDLVYDAMCDWLCADCDALDKLDIVIDYLPRRLFAQILEDYIEKTGQTERFNLWWEERYRGHV